MKRSFFIGGLLDFATWQAYGGDLACFQIPLSFKCYECLSQNSKNLLKAALHPSPDRLRKGRMLIDIKLGGGSVGMSVVPAVVWWRGSHTVTQTPKAGLFKVLEEKIKAKHFPHLHVLVHFHSHTLLPLTKVEVYT